MPPHPYPDVQARRWAFAAAVRTRRVAQHESQESLAKLAGCDRQSICRIENAAYSPSLDRVFLLAGALGISAGQLLREADALMAARMRAAS